MRIPVILLLCAGVTVATADPARPVVTLASGEQCMAGQVIIKLDRRFAREVEPVCSDGAVVVGVPVLDALNRRLGVSAMTPLVRDPEPDPRALRHGLDLWYKVQFHPAGDVAGAVSEYGECAAVACAHPNGVLVPFADPDYPDDPFYMNQWYLPKTAAPEAWGAAHGSPDVIYAELDMGVHYEHFDLADNVWINDSEDLNHNGRFDPQPPPAGDLDGVDQDGNGFADDVIGWDFHDSDPNPEPIPTEHHGTHGFGVANAVTDNDSGIAGVPWNVSGMVLRVGGNGMIDMANAVAAIYYAVDNGAWVLSMGWGTLNQYPALEAVCAFARDAGVLPVAGAGAYGDTVRVYPAAYESVVAVTASDSNDYRASFAGYGEWVDVCAPGINILSTVGVSDFDVWSGTAASTQIVAGVLAWLKSAVPGLSADSALERLYAGCDSMPDPLYAQGLLGHGRVNMANMLGLGVAERPGTGEAPGRMPTLVRSVLRLPESNHSSTFALLNSAGRKVMELESGDNDVRHLSPGVYFVYSAGIGPLTPPLSRRGRGSAKVVIAR